MRGTDLLGQNMFRFSGKGHGRVTGTFFLGGNFAKTWRKHGRDLCCSLFFEDKGVGSIKLYQRTGKHWSKSSDMEGKQRLNCAGISIPLPTCWTKYTHIVLFSISQTFGRFSIRFCRSFWPFKTQGVPWPWHPEKVWPFLLEHFPVALLFQSHRRAAMIASRSRYHDSIASQVIILALWSAALERINLGQKTRGKCKLNFLCP